MSTALVTTHPRAPLAPASLPELIPSLWRDPHSVPAVELHGIIERLRQACLDHPQSSDLHTCLGMALAMDHQVYPSFDALEEARFLDPGNFWAQMKYSELLYRVRALARAEEETALALHLASEPAQQHIARRQLQEIRRLMREGTQKPAWSKSLRGPAGALVLAGMAAAVLRMFA